MSAMDERALDRRADLEAGDFLVALLAEVELLHDLVKCRHGRAGC